MVHFINHNVIIPLIIGVIILCMLNMLCFDMCHANIDRISHTKQRVLIKKIDFDFLTIYI